jgi:hypothetical protein
MSVDFKFDVFLSHSSKDKVVVRPLAKRLRADGLKVWFDEWEIKPGDSIPAKIEEGLEHSRVLVLCMTANAFGSDWVQLEAGTFRFRDPLNKEQAYAVMLVIRTSDGEIRWMDVSTCLKRESAGGKAVKQIVFAGERFDAVSVQNWRKRVLYY